MNDYPARVNAKTACLILSITHKSVFRKVVDANPQVVHRLPGEVRPKYLTCELLALLRPAHGMRALGDKRTP